MTSIEAMADDSALALINRVAHRIADAAPLNEVLQDVVAFLLTVVKCDSCFIYVLEKDELVLRASKNPHPDVVGRLTIPMGQGITGWVAEHRQPVVLSRGAYADPRFKRFNELPEDRYEAFLSVPLFSGGRLVGVINLQDRAPHAYTDREISVVATLGFLAGSEVERARLASENTLLADRLDTTRVIERAREILQTELGITDDLALQMMQRESQDRRKSLHEIADAIVVSYAVRRRM
ncbi:MAG TPA: GAF domain-containing protein [Gemmatimonadales bacterium]|nr:GAF domain-containing protein [Gemmatimonadales bacterium]